MRKCHVPLNYHYIEQNVPIAFFSFEEHSQLRFLTFIVKVSIHFSPTPTINYWGTIDNHPTANSEQCQDAR